MPSIPWLGRIIRYYQHDDDDYDLTDKDPWMLTENTAPRVQRVSVGHVAKV